MCCGNRVAADAELAKQASASGRPPKRFPDPEDKSSGDRRRGCEDSKDMPSQREDPFRPGKNLTSAEGKKGGLLENLESFAAAPEAKKELYPFQGDMRPVREPQAEPLREPKAQKESWPSPDEPPRGSEEPPKRQPPSAEPPRRQAPPVPEESWEVKKPPCAAPSTSQAKHWEWPAWALDTKAAAIDVYVVDDDSDDKRWCPATPQFRVVDKQGYDAYLCAEYDWDGELYIQDFAPQHVRKRGQRPTIADLLHIDASGKTMGQQNIDPDTTLVVGRGPRGDAGGGVSSWLQE